MRSRLRPEWLLGASIGLLLLLGGRAQAADQRGKPDSGFSFDVYGDSRSMMYLPYRADQEAEARKLLVDMFELVLPEKVGRIRSRKGRKADLRPSHQGVGTGRHALHDG